MQKILLDDRGLKYVCQTAERFFAVSNVLRKMVNAEENGQKEPGEESLSAELLKYIVRCYLRISENLRYVRARPHPAICVLKLYTQRDWKTAHARRAREALKQCLPESMRKNTIKNGIFRTDLATQSYLQRLIKHVDSPHLNEDKLEPLAH